MKKECDLIKLLGGKGGKFLWKVSVENVSTEITEQYRAKMSANFLGRTLEVGFQFLNCFISAIEAFINEFREIDFTGNVTREELCRENYNKKIFDKIKELGLDEWSSL